MTAALGKSIVAAVRETITAIDAGPITAEGGMTEAGAGTFDADTCVVISVVGEVDGAFALRCSQTLAAQLAGSMLGIDVEPGSDDMKDAIGELFNMIVGTMKRYLSTDSDPFTMSVPTTIVGQDYSVYINAQEHTDSLRVPLSCKGHSLAIEAYLNG